MSDTYFKRTDKEFYVNAKEQACYRMTAEFIESDHTHTEVVKWDFPLSTISLDGDIPPPVYESDFYRAALVDEGEAFFALYAIGVYAPDEQVDGMETRIAWATEARAFVVDLEGEKLKQELTDAFASGDYDDGPDESDIHDVELAVQWVKSNHDNRQGLMLAQFPPTDELKDIWVKDGGKWTAATVRGSHTIPVHIGIDPDCDAWQHALDTLKKWDEAHGSEPFFVHLENDGEFLALEDNNDARLYEDFELDPDGEEEEL